MEDTRIIELYNARDEDAIRESDQKYGKLCYAIAENILKNRPDSEECVNDTWMRAWNVIPPEKPFSLRAFFSRITRNLALDRYREQQSEKRGRGELPLALEELSECVAAPHDTEEEVELRALGKAIEGFLDELPSRDRNIFLCRYYYTYSMGEIAKAFGMRENYLRNLLSRLRKKLAEHLRKEDFHL